MDNYKMLINGNYVDSFSKETIFSVNPGTKKSVATVPRGVKEDINAAVQAARTAFETSGWREIPPADRSRLLYKISSLILENKEELVRLETSDTGKPLTQAQGDVDVAARYFEYYAGVADKILGETVPIRNDILNYTVREPLGVTGHIVPWNYPLQMTARSLSASLAAGNTAVIKPAEDTPLSALKLAELCEQSGIPKGVVNVVTGYGNEAGSSLAGHSDVNHITFTGSVVTGTAVMQLAATNITPVTLELGGKSPNIVFADANLEDAAQWVVRSITQNAGQTCSAGSRLIVEESIQDQFLEILKQKMERLTIGSENADIGPIISEKQLERIEYYMEIANEENANMLCGGKRYLNNNGFFFEPTIINNLPKESRLFYEEIFGPVLVVLPFKTSSEALSIANGTEYGLVTGIWTSDINKAHWLASRVNSGQVFINNYGAAGGVEMTFGGYKKSGFGREKGLEALKYYTQVKNVALKFTID
ncbi:acyl-CoA reductase-like NAD-dependent aldehyde dehydrogenase [Virgibacillus halotolerans]|uniref:aldehyde dehydrogenase family protein n=1 Tax=Virgibacillus halotolerans TaxID=1071053 RepID=UPI00196199AA|nr:aldehyde dehydrogenase family protein [Virgibacillus halotolerans]MBM7599474.1 acyl-CoA reductase-like NAD-dependent aldehyde dehydrogenase [Virgibacillus halotolerans]